MKRMGAKRSPFYRVVVANSTAARDGKFIDSIGYYNPLTEPATFSIDEAKALKWLGVGAEPTDVTRALLTKQGVYGRFQEAKAAAKANKDAK